MSGRGTIGLLLAGCSSADSASAPFSLAPVMQEAELAYDAAPSPGVAAIAEEKSIAVGGALGRAAADKKEGFRREADEAPAPPEAPEPSPESDGQGESGEERTRSWFPEAFLWRPEVVTADDGRATLEVKVPDQLTTWRILALAHDGRGQQAGAVHTFDGTLPLYVDPVVPGWLYAGDRLVLPVQAVNTTSDPVAASLEVEAQGAMAGLGRARVTLGPAGSDVRTIPLDAAGSGEARITSRLISEQANDAAERAFRVLPSGRPVERIRGGTLSSERAFRLAPPPGADPSTEELEILVFPGPLSVVQLELERLNGGARPEDGAYGFAIDVHLSRLSEAAGVEVDEAVMRRLRILSWQRVVREARAPDPGLAADLLASVREEIRHPQVQELVPRLVRTVVDGQRPDGTWSRRSSSTLQGVLVETAVAARALPDSERGAKLRASAAIERHADQVKDPYTAAVILASGLAEEGLAERLRTVLLESIGPDEQTGEPRISDPAGVINAWGAPPTPAEMLAWTVLALPADRPERGDFAAQLMQGWSATRGFGAGRADAVALAAIASAFGGVSGPVEVELRIDGVPSASGRLDPSQPRLPVTLTASPSGGDPEIALRTTPAVPGLAFLATRRSWVPWTDADRIPGVEVEARTGPLEVGTEGWIRLTAAAPSGASLRIEQGLPSGTDVGEDARSRAEAVGASLEVLTDRVVIVTRRFQAGEVFTLELPVTPSFAGRFQTGPLEVSVDGSVGVSMRPVIWHVGG